MNNKNKFGLITATILGAPIIIWAAGADNTPTVAELPTPAPVEQVVEAPVTNGVQGRLPSDGPVAIDPDFFAEQPAEEVVEAPTPAPTPNYEYPTRQGALDEMCTAARQYGNDIYEGWMNTRQAKYELNEYARYLSRNSPVSRSELLTTGKACARSWYF